MRTFIRCIEVWVPSSDRSALEFGGGLYGTATRLAAQSRQILFGRGEGLPGRAWEAGHPIVLNDFEGSYFRRADAARADGVTCAIAVPIFAGDFLTSVLVFLCGDDEGHAGAIEVWRNVPGESKDMTLVDGYYGTTGDAFEFISRRIAFRRGNGLPGIVWESGQPAFIEDLGRSARFLRADSALKVGINRGFAMPCSTSGGDHYVLAFLSALATPIARRLEIWVPDATRLRMSLHAGFCELDGTLAASAEAVLERGLGVIGQTLLNGIPGLTDHAGDEPAVTGESARRTGLTSLVAVPVIRDGRLVATVAWFF